MFAKIIIDFIVLSFLFYIFRAGYLNLIIIGPSVLIYLLTQKVLYVVLYLVLFSVAFIGLFVIGTIINKINKSGQ